MAGKNAKQNEEVVKQAKKGELVLHTSAPGSPFCVIKGKDLSKEDVKEAAIFCACFSKAWKQGKERAEVHVFKAEDIYKNKGMKEGTFGVKKIAKRLRVSLKLGVMLRNDKFVVAPVWDVERKLFFGLHPGKLEKERTAEYITSTLKKFKINISKERIMQLIPAGGFRLVNYTK